MTLHWHTEPLLLIGLLLPAWLYSLWIGPFSSRSTRIGLGRPIAFYSGIVFTYLAVGSPLDQIGEDYLFFAHMVQHMILMYVTPVLFVLGLPSAATDQFLRHKVRLCATLRPVLNPVTAGVLFTLSFSLWHVPSLYEAALSNKTVHIIEHFTIWAPSMLVAWNLFSPSKVLPPLQYPSRMLMLFILMIAQLPVFGILTMTGDVLYPTYEWAPRIMDLSPLDDQVLGGLIMKIGGMLFVFPIFGYSFFKWAKISEKEETPPPTKSVRIQSPAV